MGLIGQLPGIANNFYNQRWQQMGPMYQANAMQGANARMGALRSGMAGSGIMNSGLGKMGLAMGKGAYFNNLNNMQGGLRQQAWGDAMGLFPYMMQGQMNADQMRYGLMGAGIDAMGQAALNWGKKG